MEQRTNETKGLATQIEEAKNEIKNKQEQLSQAEDVLGVQIEEVRSKIKDREEQLSQAEKAVREVEDSLKKAEEELKEREFQEKLELVEDKLVPHYQKEKACEDQINSSMNRLFTRTCRAGEKINLMCKELSKLKKETRSKENQIIKDAEEDGSVMREAIDLKRIHVAQDFEATKQIKGASFLVRQVNVVKGIPVGACEGLLKEDFTHLPAYAQNIYDAARNAGASALKTTMDELIRISRIPEPRIILARDMVIKFLDKLKENELIEYSAKGDSYTIKNIKA